MKMLAHIREQYGLSLGSYGHARMTMELAAGNAHRAVTRHNVGERRIDRLMWINGSAVGDSAGGTIQSRAQFALVSTRSRPTVIIVWTLQAYGLRPSMSGKGNYYDNASVEACPIIPPDHWLLRSSNR
jgi:transposase InsO family protein